MEGEPSRGKELCYFNERHLLFIAILPKLHNKPTGFKAVSTLMLRCGNLDSDLILEDNLYSIRKNNELSANDI